MGSTRLKVKVAPRSAQNRLLGLLGEELKIALTAPPVEGAANEALIKFLARLLDWPASQVKIVSGQASRHKTVLIENLEPLEAQSRLQAQLASQK